MDFSKFDKEIDVDQLEKDIAAALENGGGDYAEVPAGIYRCSVDKLEVRATKDNRPMLSAQFRIIGNEDGEKCDFTKHCIFMNRVLYGTKNDANMIASAIGWLKSLEPSEDISVVFEKYSQFADLVLDIAEDISELQYTVSYNPDAFNSITIDDVFE